MKKAVSGLIIVLGMLQGTLAHGQLSSAYLGAEDFVAPIYPGHTDAIIPNKVVGSIIFNSATGSFEGYGTDASWHIFNATNPVQSSGASERIDRAQIAQTGQTVVSSSGSPSWINSVSHTNGTGQYTLNFATAFAAAPTCTATSSQTNYTMVIAGTTTSSVSIYSYNGGTLTDGSFNVICMGAK
jgi:hypothetical protein